jgi:hypothetical protein
MRMTFNNSPAELEIHSLLTWSLQEAQRLRLPEAGQIAAILQQLTGNK